MDQAKLAKMQQSVRIGEDLSVKRPPYDISFNDIPDLRLNVPLTSLGFRVSLVSSSQEWNFNRI